MNKILINIYVLLAILSLSISAFLVGRYIYPKPSSIEPIITRTLDTEKNTYKYYYHRIIASGKDANGENFLIKLQLGRASLKEGGFSHSYLVSKVQSKNTINNYESFENTSSDISVNKVFNYVDITTAADNSPRESYSFEINIKGEIYTLVTDELEGDFLIKQTKDYYRTISTSKASLQSEITGTINLNVMVDQIFSNDPTYFTGDIDDWPKHETHSIVLWDEDDNFYLIDQTNVHEISSEYVSHTWIITKKNDGTMKKYFDARINFKKSSDDKPSSWEISIHDTNDITISLDKSYEFTKKTNSGLLLGTIKIDNTSNPISGHFVYANHD